MAVNINFNAIADEFKRTNWKDPGTWHAAPKLVVLLLILVAIPVAGFFVDTQGQIDELERMQGEEAKLKEQYLDKKKQAVNLDLHRQQLREIDTQFGALLRQLPNRSQMDALLVDINQAGLGRGLQFELFRPAPGEITREFYAERPITLKMTGSYHDMGAFASDVGPLPRIVTLNDVAISHGSGNDTQTLTMDVTARTFRYLDDDEVAAQRRSSAKSKGKKRNAASPSRLLRRRSLQDAAGTNMATSSRSSPRPPRTSADRCLRSPRCGLTNLSPIPARVRSTRSARTASRWRRPATRGPRYPKPCSCMKSG